MKIRTTKHFDKQYVRLLPSVQLRLRTRLEIFKSSPFDPELRNHGLKGKYKGLRSIDVTGDVRALYKEIVPNEVLFGFIGSHSQLYG